MKIDKLISFLYAIRGHPELCMESFRSIIENATDTIPYEVLIAIDNDDEKCLNLIPEIYKLFDDTINGTCQIIITPRYYYHGLDKYYNYLAKFSTAKLMAIMNSDCLILNSHIHQPGINQDHTLSNWDILLAQDLEDLEDDILVLYSMEVYFGGDERHPHTNVGAGCFPIILRKTYDLVGHISCSATLDEYVDSVIPLLNRKVSRMILTHITPKDGPITDGSAWRKSWALLQSDDIQAKIKKDKSIIEKYLKDRAENKVQHDLPYWDKYIYTKENPEVFGIPKDHIDTLKQLREGGFNPKIIYDIGSNVGHWREVALKIWPEAKIFMFEANEDLKLFYDYYGWKDYHIGLLSNTDNKPVNYYYNEEFIGGNSYYKENTEHHIWERFRILNTQKLETVITNNGWPMPDLIKLDVQGAEIDILKGSGKILKYPEHIIVELQHMNYNEGASLAEESIDIIENLGYNLLEGKFSAAVDVGIDADYLFVNKDYIGENRR